MLKYEFVMVPYYATNDTLSEYAIDGWAVHTLNRHGETVDILFVRQVIDALLPNH